MTSMWDFAAALKTAWTQHNLAEEKGPPAPRTHVWASGLHSCILRMMRDMQNPEEREPFTADAVERMKKGKIRERSITQTLMELGEISTPRFEVQGLQESFVIKDRDGRALMSGKVDGRLKIQGMKYRPVYEVKSGQTFAKIETIEQMDAGVWTEHAADQLLSYLYDRGEPWGLFILDRPGLPFLLPVSLEDNLQRMEDTLQGVRWASRAAEGLEAPPPFTERRELCKRCPHFGRSCAPPLDFGEGLKIITDPDLIQAAADVVALEEAAGSHARAKKKLADSLRGVPLAMLGDVQATGKWQGENRAKVPEEVAAKYKVYNPQAKFVIRYESSAVE